MNLLQKCNGKVLIFEHPPTHAERQHCHAYLFDMTIKYDAVQERVRKFGFKGNTDFEVAGHCGKRGQALDLSGAYAYGSGADVHPYPAWEPVYSRGITDEEHKELREYASKLNKKLFPVLPVRDKPEVVKEKKLTQWQMITEMISEINPLYFKLSLDEKIDYLEELTSKYLTEKQIFSGMFKQQDYIFCIMRSIGDESYKQALRARCKKYLDV